MKDQAKESNCKFGPPGMTNSMGHNSLLRRVLEAHEHLMEKPLKPTFRLIKKHYKIPSESPSNYREMFRPLVLG
jgi:hypothetical protein